MPRWRRSRRRRYRAEWLDPSLRPPEPQAYVELMRVAARACGVATEGALADYFRISRRDARRGHRPPGRRR